MNTQEKYKFIYEIFKSREIKKERELERMINEFKTATQNKEIILYIGK